MSLSLALILGLIFSRFAKKVGLPAVTAYLVAGVCLGPYCLGRIGIGGFGFNSGSYINNFEILSSLALGFIAFTIGNEFKLKELKTMGKQAITVGILQAVITTVLVDVVLILFHFLNPDIISLPVAIVLGAIAAATAPAATLMVVKQYKAEGPLKKLLLMVVAIDDAVGLVLFSVSFGIAGAVEKGVLNVASMIFNPLIELVLSCLIGCVSGYLLTILERFFHSRSKRLSLVVGFVMLICSLSMIEFHAGSIIIKSSLLLVCMLSGTTFCNACPASDEIFDRLDRWTAPICILFFVISGAELDFAILGNPLVLLIGAIYIIARSAGKMSGSYISTRMTGCSPEIQKYLGITLLPQAGVALGMANEALVLNEGKVICNIILFSVFVYELVGPALTKMALMKAGEIEPEGRRSARQVNNNH